MAHAFRIWLSQILAVLGAATVVAGMVILLAVYDGRPIFSWHNVTLNTLVSILSTASKALLLFAVGEAISQWKWIEFSRERRPLIDFQRIDHAGHGSLGSLRLIFSRNQKIFLRLGAIVVIISLATDPFAQQLIQLRQDVSYTSGVGNNTIVPLAKRYSLGDEFRSSSMATILAGDSAVADFSMKSAILFGLAQPLANIMQQLSFSCPTGNCTWESFESLAICSKCYNLTSDVKTTESTGSMLDFVETYPTNTKYSLTYRLPNGLLFDNTTTYGPEGFQGVPLSSFGTGNASETNKFQDSDTLIWAMSFFKNYAPVPSPATAQGTLPFDVLECGIYYCVKEYTPSVQSGTLQESAVDVSATRNSDSWKPTNTGEAAALATMDPDPSSIAFNRIFSTAHRSDLQLVTPAGTYNISQSAVDSISSYFVDNFGGANHTVGPTSNRSTNPLAPGQWNGYYSNTSQTRYDPSPMQVFWSTANISETFEGLARSMSNAVRAGADSSPTKRGVSGVVVTYYHVQWPWIILQLVILAVGGLFLVVTMWESRSNSTPVWTSSSLATMMWGSRIDDTFDHLMKVEKMEERAKNEMVALKVDLKTDSNSNPVESSRALDGLVYQPADPGPVGTLTDLSPGYDPAYGGYPAQPKWSS